MMYFKSLKIKSDSPTFLYEQPTINKQFSKKIKNTGILLFTLLTIFFHSYAISPAQYLSGGAIKEKQTELQIDQWMTIQSHQLQYNLRKERENERRNMIVNTISKTYRIAKEPATKIVLTAHEVSDYYNIDPVLLLSIIAVESRFNPYAESHAGALGLGQIIPKWHPQHLDDLLVKGLERDVLNPYSNIYLAGAIYKEYLDKQSGNSTRALQQYNGSLWDTQEIYPRKVFNAYQIINKGIPKRLSGPTLPHEKAGLLAETYTFNSLTHYKAES